MVRSMTGYGRAQEVIGPRDITVEIKSVNHRFFEFSARTPRAYGYLEEKLKAFLQGQVLRGKVEASVFIQMPEGEAAQVCVNRELAGAYVKALRSLGGELAVQDDLTLSAVACLPDLFSVTKPAEDEAEVWEAVEKTAEKALNRFLEMRAVEGERLCKDVLCCLQSIEESVRQIAEAAPKTVEAYRSRLLAKLQEVLADRQVDEARIVTEAAVFADKIAVDEEMVRLRSHIAQFRDIIETGGPIGRKLDFLVQEMNREANTIGSKAQDASIAQIVVGMKSSIEKIREQIQNIE